MVNKDVYNTTQQHLHCTTNIFSVTNTSSKTTAFTPPPKVEVLELSLPDPHLLWQPVLGANVTATTPLNLCPELFCLKSSGYMPTVSGHC